MRWLRFEMKGMVDVKFIFIDKRKEEYYAGCFYFLYTKTCVNYLQLRQAKKWSLKLSKFEQFHIQWHTPLASLLGLNSHFAGPVQKSIGFIFYFLFFIFFWLSKMSKWQWRMKIMVMTELISMTNSRTEHEMSFILHFFFYYIFLGVYFDNSVLASAFYITF